jgi:hypothetical protein
MHLLLQCPDAPKAAITLKFPFFLRLYSMWSGRPNYSPIAVTTGVGPNGHQTLFLQDPQLLDGTGDITADANIDPVLRTPSSQANPNPSPARNSPETLSGPMREFGADVTNSQIAKPASKGQAPRSSLFTAAALQKA